MNTPKASIDTSIASEPEYIPDRRITKAVSEQRSIVSINTSTIPKKPCSHGELVSLPAWAVGDVPLPASFESIPRATPNRIARTMPYEAIPVPADLKLNALLNIISITSGNLDAFVSIMYRETTV